MGIKLKTKNLKWNTVPGHDFFRHQIGMGLTNKRDRNSWQESHFIYPLSKLHRCTQCCDFAGFWLVSGGSPGLWLAVTKDVITVTEWSIVHHKGRGRLFTYLYFWYKEQLSNKRTITPSLIYPHPILHRYCSRRHAATILKVYIGLRLKIRKPPYFLKQSLEKSEKTYRSVGTKVFHLKACLFQTE